MAKSKQSQYEWDGLVLHSEEERDRADNFCKYVREIKLADGRNPRIEIMDNFEKPGRQEIANLDLAINAAEYIFFSEAYYRNEEMGYFSGNVAIPSKLPDKFIRLIIGNVSPSEKCSLPSIRSFKGIRLNENWDVSTETHKHLLKIFTTSKRRESLEVTMSELTLADNLVIANPSISSLSSISGDNSQTGCRAQTASRGPQLFSASCNESSQNLPGDDLVADNQIEVVKKTAQISPMRRQPEDAEVDNSRETTFRNFFHGFDEDLL